ncbi:MAG TPA: hypothetical protein VIR57_14365, partial [Chloroflexota bacterium]
MTVIVVNNLLTGRTAAAIVATVLITACGGGGSGSVPANSPQPSPTPSPKAFKAQAAIDAWTQAGLKVTNVATCATPGPSAPIPRTWAENVCFTIPSVSPHGGQLFSFDSVQNERAIVAYFALFPALAPYVYAHANV